MITRIKAENFKCLKRLDVPLKGLTVLTGLNGAGKSSVIQAMLYIRQCVYNAKSGSSFVELRSGGLQFVNAKDVVYQFSPDDNVRVLVGAVADGDAGRECLNYVFEDTLQDSSLEKIKVQELDNRAPSRSMVASLFSVKRLRSSRLGPIDIHNYKESEIRARNIGEIGENAVGYLFAYGSDPVAPELIFKDKYNTDATSLLPQVGTWLRMVSRGVSVFIDSAAKSDTNIPLYFKYGSGVSDKKFRPTNVGTGLSMVLPVLVMLLSAKKGDCLIIENPESDLHPRGQAELAKLIARTARSGVQVILETHSDHIINGIRVAIKKKEISRKDVNIVFFRKMIDAENTEKEEQYSDYDVIDLDDNGTLSKCPSDFMEEWGKLLDQLLDGDAIADSEESNDDGISE